VLSFLVPPGTAAEWRTWLERAPYGRQRTVAAAGPGRVLRCSRPGCVRQGHVWLSQPTGALTDGQLLRAALEDSVPRHSGGLLSDLLSR
jgi:hypothetical protein